MVRKVYPSGPGPRRGGGGWGPVSSGRAPRRPGSSFGHGSSRGGYGPAEPYQGRTGFLSGRRAEPGRVPVQGYRRGAPVPEGPMSGLTQAQVLAWAAGPGQVLLDGGQVPGLPVLNPALAAQTGQVGRVSAGGVPAGGRALEGMVVAHGGQVPVRPGDGLVRALGWLWAYRWPLSPVAGPVLLAGGVHAAPGPVTAVAAAAAAGLWWWARSGRPVRGRMWLSVRERQAAAVWWTAAAGWAPVAGYLSPGAGAVLLAAALGWPSWVWWTSRRIRPVPVAAKPVGDLPEREVLAAALIAAWPQALGGQDSPEALRGSRIVAESMTFPAPGAFAFAVELAGGVHAEDAVGEAARKAIERRLRLPVGTVTLGVDRDDCARLRIGLSPARHLEMDAAPWDGGVLAEDGTFAAALCPDGSQVRLATWNDSGVEHIFLVGAPNTGKSCTSAVLLLPGVLARREVVLYVDGGEGGSAAFLARGMDLWANTPQRWAAAIEIAHQVLLSRKARRAKAGLSKWRGLAETDPALTLMLEEATTIRAWLTTHRPHLIGYVEELVREGRKYGIRVGQIVQDPMGVDCIGGRKIRDMIAGAGCVVAHRPGGKTAARLSVGSTSEKVDLTKLPEAGGWAAVIRRGKLLSTACRVQFADEDIVRDRLAGFTPRALEGADAAAAGPAYAGRFRGTDADAGFRAALAGEDLEHEDLEHDGADGPGGDAPVAEPAVGGPGDDQDRDGEATTQDDAAGEADEVSQRLNSSAAAAAATRAANTAQVRQALTAGPLTRAELAGTTGLSRSTVHRILGDLAESHQIVKEGDSWALTSTDA